MKARIKALASFLGCKKKEIEECTYSDNTFEADGGEYLVLTDSEADDMWDEYMENYIDDCVLDQLPEAYRFYFDREAFKRDCSFDGRGHSLASYDGHENEEDGYYIYRVN